MQGEQAYDIDILRRRIPEDRSELYLGFVPWQEDLGRWVRTVHEQLAESPGKPVLRTVWDDPENRDARVLVEVATRASAQEAVEALVERLSWNQLAVLPEGPQDLGYASFVHPGGVPPAVYFVQGNLCIMVASFARAAAPVLPLASRLAHRLAERPHVERMTMALEPDRSSIKVGEPILIRYDLPWTLGEGGFVKFFCLQGTLRLEEDRVVLRGTRPGRVSVEAFVLEPGRETYGGRLEISVE